jgi:hypothetical protein
VHKLDGQPVYAWEQREDDTWHRVPVEGARDELLGVVRERDYFHFTYRFELPQLDEPTQLWVPLTQSDAFQKVRVEKIDTPAPWELVADRSGENAALAMQVGPEQSGRALEIRYKVARVESGPYAKHPSESPARHLEPESLVPADPTFIRPALQLSGLPHPRNRRRADFCQPDLRVRTPRANDAGARPECAEG